MKTASQQLVTNLQQKYGSANFRKWQGLRRTFYSFVKYAEAGQSELRFFGSAISSTTNRQLTNMPKANSFGQNHFLLKAIRCDYFIPDQNNDGWVSTDASTLYSDFIAGVFQAGVLEFSVGAKIVVQVPKPMLYCPPANGRTHFRHAGLTTLTLTEGTPNVILALNSPPPFADLNGDKKNLYVVDPNIVIEAEQNFDVAIRYPSGSLGITAATITDDTTNPLYFGVYLDGIVFRPQQ